MAERAPRLAVAELLAFALPPGVGQAYLGLTRRAIAWFAVFEVLLFAVPLAVPALGAAVGARAAVAVYLVLLAARWFAPPADVLLVRKERYGQTRTGLVIAFACVGVINAVVLAVSIRITLVEAFKIPSGAMIPTLLVGDHIFVDKLVYRTRAPRRGEVMVFAFPEQPQQDFIKRVVLLPGDRLEVKSGHPWINGWEVPHCKVGPFSYDEEEETKQRHTGELDVEFLDEQAYLTFYDDSTGGFTEHQGPYVAKPSEYWVLGDNRNNSHDSRMWFGGVGGGVPRELVRGHAVVIWMSLKGAGQEDSGRTFQPVEGTQLPAGASSLQPALDACMKARPSLAATTPPPPG